MPNERFLKRDLATGKDYLQEAISSSAGAGDAGKIPALDAAGKLASSLMPAGIGADTYTAEATEALSAGEFVEVWWDGANREARLADANNGRPANGFVADNYTLGAAATIYPLGTLNNQQSGLTAGNIYFLGNVAGGVTDDISAFVDTDIVQRLGLAISATEILTENNTPAYIADA